MHTLRFVFAVFLFGSALAALPTSSAHATATDPMRESAYDRVIRTNTIRCGYWVMPPFTQRDPNTGTLKGAGIALFEELATRLSLKVEWVEEVSFATMFTGLETNRYDAICTGVFLAAARVRAMEFTTPYLLSRSGVVVRADDTRFDGDIRSLNNPSVRIAVHDSLSISVANRLAPKAQRIALPETSDAQQLLLEVATKKADATFYEVASFQKGAPNSDQLKLIHPGGAAMPVFPWVLAVRKGEHTLASLLDGALIEMLYNNEIPEILKANGIPPHSYQYVTPPLQWE